ncbi:MAG: 2-amino-4-hydroxy-6-hydroxymethyldihydropteridine diphosphokinase [Desulfobacteraceae bacterium]|nr:2-amino-4-hydroxy-6-hydroxymethyldihydropteridine diphosphokinase [Desulfobacteraceae bacterium]
MSRHWAYISIGSNLGDRLQNCLQGIAALEADHLIQLVARSPFYETEPVDFLDQDWFLNGAIKIETVLAPLELLGKLQRVQAAAGRTSKGVRYGPRVLDLDIIFYEDLVMRVLDLTIPHERMHKRRFVLQPICDIDASVVHPVLKKDVRQLLAQLNPEEQKIRPCSFGS